MLKVVLDTSVFVSAFLSRSQSGAPAQINAAWQEGRFTLVMAPPLMEELAIVLLRRGVPPPAIETLIATIGTVALQIPGAYQATRLEAIDPNDNMFLAAAYEANADFLVSVDNDLLHLKHYHGTQIRTPALFLRSLLPLR